MLFGMKNQMTALLALVALLLAMPVMAQDAPEVTPQPELVRVEMETDLGTIVLALDKTNAPITTANFLRYADEQRFDGTVFYRAMRLDWGTQPNGLIQGGTQYDPKRVLPPIPHEPTSETGITHRAGTISMARYDLGTATGDFTIMVSPQPGLNAQPEAEDPAMRPGFAAFGQVAEGMEVVRAIFDAPISPTRGEGFMKGQMIDQPVKIVSVRRIPGVNVAGTER